MLFLDANRANPVPHLYPLEATNPSVSNGLAPYENCCLGSINLAEHCGPDGQVDWDDSAAALHYPPDSWMTLWS
jgi:ribonucleoside-diphosphate reductase alpha chain